MNTNELDFDSLNSRSPGNRIWCNTFAYWLGVLKPNVSEQVLQELGDFMAIWYDNEEQAEDLEWFAIGPDLGEMHQQPLTTFFRPIAPVTLAKRWSPFPLAFDLLGTPNKLLWSKRKNQVTAIFQPRLHIHPPSTSPDEDHFLFLLRHACDRAFSEGRTILLSGSPGWSYDSEDYVAEDPILQQVMTAFGYVFCGRKPLP